MNLTEKEEQGARLEQLIMSLNITQSEFSKTIGVSQGYISRVIMGEKSLSHRVITNITSGYEHVNVNWLLTGKGERFLEKEAVYSTPPVAGLLTGVMEPAAAEYRRGEGRLEWLERRVKELEGELAEVRRRIEVLEASHPGPLSGGDGEV